MSIPYLHRPIVVLRNRFRFDVGLKACSKVLLHKGLKGVYTKNIQTKAHKVKPFFKCHATAVPSLLDYRGPPRGSGVPNKTGSLQDSVT